MMILVIAVHQLLCEARKSSHYESKFASAANTQPGVGARNLPTEGAGTSNMGAKMAQNAALICQIPSKNKPKFPKMRDQILAIRARRPALHWCHSAFHIWKISIFLSQIARSKVLQGWS